MADDEKKIYINSKPLCTLVIWVTFGKACLISCTLDSQRKINSFNIVWFFYLKWKYYHKLMHFWYSETLFKLRFIDFFSCFKKNQHEIYKHEPNCRAEKMYFSSWRKGTSMYIHDWLIDWLLNVPIENISCSWRRHHCCLRL